MVAVSQLVDLVESGLERSDAVVGVGLTRSNHGRGRIS